MKAAEKKLIAAKIIDVPNYPIEGVSFKDITPLLADPKALATTMEALAAFAKDLKPDLIVAPEARGFMVGTALAYLLNCGFVPARKPNKLPRPFISHEYAMEYGKSSLEMHKDAVFRGARVLIVDDLLASGGTAVACTKLAEKLGGNVVGYAFVILLKDMMGQRALNQQTPAFWCLEY